MSSEQIDRLRQQVSDLEKINEALRQQNNYLQTLVRKLFQDKGDEYLAKLDQIMKQKEDQKS